MATHPESLLISAMIRSKDATTHAHAGITVNHFHVYEHEWRWIERHIARWQRTPSLRAFRLKYPDFPIDRVDDVEHFCEEVRREHAQFVLADVVEQTMDFAEQGDIEAGIATLRSGVAAMESSIAGDSGSFSLMNDADIIYADVKRRTEQAAESGLAGVPLGFPTLDDVTGGGQAGDYMVIGARLSTGKTWTMIQMAVAAMKAGYTPLFVSLEQNRNQISFRIHNLLSVSFGSEVFSSSALSTGVGFSLAQYKQFLTELKKQKDIGDIHVLDGTRGRVNVGTIATNIERIKPDIVFVDYLTLLDMRDKDWQSVAKLSGDMQALAMRYQIPVVVAAQMNRGGEGKEPPSASDLALSDAIGQDADVVVSLGKQSEHVLKMRLAKNRNGQDQTSWYCHFDPSSGKFTEISRNQAMNIIDSDEDE